MKGMYSIGELSKKTGLTVHTLRYYDSIDLLKPDYIDELTGYRYYDAAAFWNVEIIKMFKGLNIPLVTLKEILQNMDNDSINEILQEKKKEIRKSIKKNQQMLKDIDWFKESLEEMTNIKESEIFEKEKESTYVIYVENQRQERELHLTLQDISLKEMEHTDTLRRKYGYIIDNKLIYNNVFFRKGEYLNLYSKKYNYTEKQYIYKIPKGRYVCQIVEIKNHLVDMSDMRKYLNTHELKVKEIYAEEIGLPLFDFNQYKCELQILVEDDCKRD